MPAITLATLLEDPDCDLMALAIQVNRAWVTRYYPNAPFCSLTVTPPGEGPTMRLVFERLPDVTLPGTVATGAVTTGL